MSDDDDWVGEPPEGRHSRDRAKPGFWANQWQGGAITGAVILLLIDRRAGAGARARLAVSHDRVDDLSATRRAAGRGPCP